MSRKPTATGSKPFRPWSTRPEVGGPTALGRFPSITAKISSTFSFPVRIKSPFSTHQLASLSRGLSVRPPFRIGANAACRFFVSRRTDRRRSSPAGGEPRDGHHARNTRMTRASSGVLPDTANTNPCRAKVLSRPTTSTPLIRFAGGTDCCASSIPCEARSSTRAPSLVSFNSL